MIRDVFYYGKKPNIHPREKFASSFEDAKKQNSTEHFWIVNEFCDYTNFDWDFDFDFLSDEDVWTQDHINIWPSIYQKDSGTWLCSETCTEIKIYRADVNPIKRKNELNDNWILVDNIDKTKFDFGWHPDPTDPPYIYKWGCKFFPVELQSSVEYHVANATDIKYMNTSVELLPNYNCIVEHIQIDKHKFDLSWRPDPLDSPYIYIWGNKWIPGVVEPTLEYRVAGATEHKYMPDLLEILPIMDRWVEIQSVDKTKFDYTWIPDPTAPPYIYVWGNRHIPGELKSTIEYHCLGATDKKYMSNDIEVLPELDRWVEIQSVDKVKFDLSWRPDPREPAYIYVWGNHHIPGELKSTIEYHCPGATDKKYIGTAHVTPEWDKWKILIPVDKTKFDFTWRPDPREPAYIYVWGNQYNPVEVEPTIEYCCNGATERKYIHDVVVSTLPIIKNWKILIPIEKFDLSWRPDPNSPPYIYVFGNQWHDAMTEPTLEYHVEEATDKKYITDVIATVSSTHEHWKTLIPVENFDYSWRPNPHSPPYIYVFGNKWNDAATEPTIEYKLAGATEYKYVDYPIATPKVELKYWQVNNTEDLTTFDFTWRPNPHSPLQIYQWENNGPRYTLPNATEVVLMKRTDDNNIQVNQYIIRTTLDDLINEHPDEVFWAINPDLQYTKFDFTWKPSEENFRHINVFGNEYSKNTQTYYVNGPMYMMGHREFNYVEDQIVEIDSSMLDMFFIDKHNKQSQIRFDALKQKYPQLQKTRYLNTWVDTITRCCNKSTTKFFWVLSSELDYTDFTFDFYPSPWQEKMVHVFGTQWSNWGNTYFINKDSFVEDTKYVKIIEHLSVLNFVKSKKAKIVDVLHDIVFLDHGNFDDNDMTALDKGNLIVKYEKSYLNTFKNILSKLPIKKEHYVWIISTVCDYSNFDFTYACDPFAKEQLHVFPSEKQKFGDTFLVDVNKLRSLVDSMSSLEDYDKINFNQHQKVSRLPSPVFVTSDTHTECLQDDYKFPYATYVTSDNQKLSTIKDTEPMSLWDEKSKNILITSAGGTRIVAPKEAKNYVKTELYDYPYIKSSVRLVDSKPLDIIFFSNGEVGADENYDHLLLLTAGMDNRVTRVDGVQGRVASQHAAANASDTPWYFLVNAKLKVNSKFDFDWQPDRLQIAKHYIFTATNPVNHLEYGHQAIVANNKNITINTIAKGLDFTMDGEHEVVQVNSGIGIYNTSVWDTWRTAFRETLKLKAYTEQNNDTEAKFRLSSWLNIGDGDFGNVSMDAALDACRYYESVNGELAKLRLSYDWVWLRRHYERLYPN